MFYSIIIIGVLLIGAFILFRKYNMTRKKQTRKVISTTKVLDQFVEVEARVYDNDTRMIYNAVIPGDIVREIRHECGNLGRKWLREGKWIYALNKRIDGRYKPVEVPVTLDDPPSELHRALQQYEVPIVYNFEESKGLLQKWGHIIMFCGVAAVALFILIAQNIQG